MVKGKIADFNLINCEFTEYFFFFLPRFAYVEFADKDSVGTAMALDESLFRGRQIKVSGILELLVASQT